MLDVFTSSNIDLSLLPPCPPKHFPLLLFYPTLRKLRRREVREGAAHKLKPHRLSDPSYIKSEALTYTKTPELQKSDRTWCSRKSIRVKRVLTASLYTVSDRFCTVRQSENLYCSSMYGQYIQNTKNKVEIERVKNNHKCISAEVQKG